MEYNVTWKICFRENSALLKSRPLELNSRSAEKRGETFLGLVACLKTVTQLTINKSNKACPPGVRLTFKPNLLTLFMILRTFYLSPVFMCFHLMTRLIKPAKWVSAVKKLCNNFGCERKSRRITPRVSDHLRQALHHTLSLCPHLQSNMCMVFLSHAHTHTHTLQWWLELYWNVNELLARLRRWGIQVTTRKALRTIA